MFSKQKEVKKSKIYDVTILSPIPENDLLDNCMFELLKQIICLLREEFFVIIQARFNNSDYNQASIMLLKGLYDYRFPLLEEPNKKAIQFLKANGGVETHEYQPNPSLWTNTDISFSTKDLVKVKDKLEQRHEANIQTSMCRLRF